jgi:hypothetical protein
MADGKLAYLKRIVVSLVAAFGIAAGTASAVPAVGASPATLKVATCMGPQVRPTRIDLGACNAIIALWRIHWTTWGLQGATGSGVLYWDDCIPTCFGGTYKQDPARI